MHHPYMHDKLMVLIIIYIVLLKCSVSQSTVTDLNTLTVSTSNYDENVSTTEFYEIHRSQDKNESELDEKKHHSGIHLIGWRWDEIGLFYTMTLFVVITGLSKVVFHYAHWLSSRLPESCSLIIIGIVVGSILHATGVTESSDMPTFTPSLFFLILLPPVILEAAYSLYNATFFDNLSTILLYAVVVLALFVVMKTRFTSDLPVVISAPIIKRKSLLTGTIFNTISIGAILYGLGSLGLMGELTFGVKNEVTDISGEAVYHLPLVQCLVFSALISAVDPVAVLAIFQEVGVNKDLYFLVFGESLFNDAITVVLYTTMGAFLNMTNIGGEQCTLAVLSFFTVNCGGIIIGVFYGLLTALLTQATGAVRVVEPLAVLGIAYLSYLSAELFHLSGIISIICCGLVQAHYSFKNISQKSYVTVKYFTKMISSTSEAIIFLFLGTVLVSAPHEWHTGFVMWTLLLCMLCRFIGVFVLTSFSNRFCVKRTGLQEQFIMAYGGLRGAVGFSLVMMLENTLKARQVFVTTTLVVILFTVFIQGGSIKPLVKLLHIEVSKKSQHSLIGEINNQVTSHLMAGIEEIVGFKGNFYIKRKIQDIDEKYLQKIFYKNQFENKIKQVYEKWSLSQHYAHLYGPITLVEDHATDILHDDYKDESLKLPHNIPFIPERRPNVDEDRSLRKRISETFSGVEFRKHDDDSGSNKELLRKAFLSNPFNLYHYRYNRNLINDDAQEINSQLKLRRDRARHITRLAFENAPNASSTGENDLNSSISETFNHARKKVFSEIEGAPLYEIGGMDSILKRAQRRRTIHLGSTASDSVGVHPKDKPEMSQLPEEEVYTSQACSIKETEIEPIKEMIPLLSDDSDRKSNSPNEESPV